MNSLTTSILPAAIAFASGIAACPAQSQQASCDETNIHWVLPGDFSTALDRAKNERRLVLIKGISFGVDQAGAACATTGSW